MLSENDMDHAETESTADAEPTRAHAPEAAAAQPDSTDEAAATAVEAAGELVASVEAAADIGTDAAPDAETEGADAESVVTVPAEAVAEAAADAALVAAAEPAEAEPAAPEAAAPEILAPETEVAEITVAEPVVASDFAIRMAEALIFASANPITEAQLTERLPEGTDLRAILAELATIYAERGVNLVSVAGGWAFRTAPDLATMLRTSVEVPRKLSRAAMEALAIIAYHQPVTRGEIEEIRGVALSKGTLDVLLEIGWIKPRGRKQTPGRPAMWGTTDEFLNHFGLASVEDLPGVEELKAAGLLDRRPAMTTLAMRDAEKGEAPDAAETEEAEVRAEREAAAVAEMDGAPAAPADGEAAADAEAPPADATAADADAAAPAGGDAAAVAALEAEAEAGLYEETDEDDSDEDDDSDDDYDDEDDDDDYDDDEDDDGGAKAESIAAAAAIEEPR